jgi:chromosome segregation ATPase
VKRYISGILRRVGYVTAQEKALGAEVERLSSILTGARARAENFERQLNQERDGRKAEFARLEAEITEMKALLTRERALGAKHIDRVSLRVAALKRLRERLKAELQEAREQLARADVSGRIRGLEEENARLQQRLADLQTYFQEK